MLETHHLMFTLPDNEPLKNLVEPKTGLSHLEEQLPGSTYSEPVAEQTVTVKLEPNGEDFQTLSQAGTENGSAASDQNQLWTSALEKSGDEQNVCILLQDVKYHLSPAAGATNEQQGYTSPIKDLPFLDHKEKEDPFSLMGIQTRSSDLTLAPELHEQNMIQEVTVNEFTAAGGRTQGGGVFEYDMTTSDGLEGGDATAQNCFICSACGQSFDSFSLFQTHQCNNNNNNTEQTYSCDICGKMFSQMSILKLHLKLHVK